MYKVKIKTIYNTIEFITDDLSKYQELFEQPYVIEVYINSTEQYKLVKEKKCIKN